MHLKASPIGSLSIVQSDQLFADVVSDDTKGQVDLGVKLLALGLVPIGNLEFSRVRLDRLDLILKRMPMRV